MKKSERFLVKEEHKIDAMNHFYVLEDKETSVQYLANLNGANIKSIIPLLDVDGKPLKGN